MGRRKTVTGEFPVGSPFYNALKEYLPLRRAAMLAVAKERAALKRLKKAHTDYDLPKLVKIFFGKHIYEIGYMSMDVELPDLELMWAGLTFEVKEVAK